MRYAGRNIRPFTAVSQCNFGRQIIYTNVDRVDETNILEELASALTIHRQNEVEIEYLDRYYRGDQPILYRRKVNRPEVNNKVVDNIAYFIVESHVAKMVAEPIQYVQHGSEEKKAKEIVELNKIMEGEDKSCDDIELCRWRAICGTAYRYIGKDDGDAPLLDEADFYMSVEHPGKTFVAYYQNKRPAFSCQIRKDGKGEKIYNIFTNSQYFIIKNNEIIKQGINGNGAIPVVEYPNNDRRLSAIEITITITDEINKFASDRSNSVEQFVASWIKFINCEIDSETFQKMRMEGALVVKSNNGAENKADVDVMTTELNQTQTQVAIDDQWNKLLIIQGIASREGNTGGDTGSAVNLRNGHNDAEERAEISEPIFKKSERMFLRLVLNRLRIKRGFKLLPSDVEIHISRTKSDNMLTKAEVLQILLACGVENSRAIKTVGIWSDPEQVAQESKDRMELLYPSDEEKFLAQQNTPVQNDTVELPDVKTDSSDDNKLKTNNQKVGGSVDK